MSEYQVNLCLVFQEITKGVVMRPDSVLDVAITCIMVLVVVASGYLSVTRNEITLPREVIVVVVRPGENLWSLAEAHPVHGLDTAQTVALIRLLNTKSDSALKPGEAVIVPITANVR